MTVYRQHAVRVLEYDVEDFFKSCVTAYAEVTDTDLATYPKSGTPFGQELTIFEDGQEEPGGEGDASPAEEDLAECMHVHAAVGPRPTWK